MANILIRESFYYYYNELFIYYYSFSLPTKFSSKMERPYGYFLNEFMQRLNLDIGFGITACNQMAL